ncbi:hypothetical protein SPB21_05700 [Leptothoe sp. ISB3NOV94-8A]
MAKQSRSVPTEIASQLASAELAILQEALDHFDGSYRSLMDHLKSLNAPQVVYMMVNGAAKFEMGKPRKDVDLGNAEEMNVWGDGYTLTEESMDDLSDPRQTTADAFVMAKRLNGWLPWE